MAGYSDQVLKLHIPGDLSIDLEAHYDIDIQGDRRTGEMSYTIDLGYVDWTLAGHKMYSMEGKEIPPLMREKILGAITVTHEEMSDALKDADDEEAFRRAHAVGFV